MNFDRWIDLYKRQPLSPDRSDGFDEAAFLREVQADDDEREQRWKRQDRVRIGYFSYFIISGLLHLDEKDYSVRIVAGGLLMGYVITTWWQGRQRRQLDREYKDSLLARIARATKLIQLRQSYLRLEPAIGVICGLLGGELAARITRDHGSSNTTVGAVAVAAGLLFAGLTGWWIFVECRKQHVDLAQRLDYLHRVRTRLLSEPHEKESPSSSLSP